MKLAGLVLVLLVLSGCASQGVIKNVEKPERPSAKPYSFASITDRTSNGNIGLILAFSGGGTRAAALSYGVLQELRDSTVVIDGHEHRMLDEIDAISSVSGGSFTSAYYGLNGEGIFDDFEDVFLKRDVQHQLLVTTLNPLHWFSSTGRTERAMKLYEKEIFHDKTFADMQAKDGPAILINASDLGYGLRFSFIQDYFDFLCSDLSSFPVARAVAASSAVPILFNPVVVENHPGCEKEMARFEHLLDNQVLGNPELAEVVNGLTTYKDKEQRKYAHFVDGGITDNLGLRAVYEIIEVTGGAQAFMQRYDRKPPRRLIIISVDASTDPLPGMDQSLERPSLEESIGAVSSVQLHLYNAATLNLMDRTLKQWAQELSTPKQTVEPYFITIGFNDIKQPDELEYFNSVPTTFRLSDEQVDRLIAAGRELLRSNPDFQRLLAGLKGRSVAAP
jgi:NTE family protein